MYIMMLRMYLSASLPKTPIRPRKGLRFLSFVFFLSLIFWPAPGAAQAALGLAEDFLAGGQKGLYWVSLRPDSADVRLIWDKGSVKTILPFAGGWYFLGSDGVVFSPDLRRFENRSGGLPAKTLKIFEQDRFVPLTQRAEIKSLAVDPAQPNRLAACTGTEIWYSETSGKSWISLGAPSSIPGLKAVAFGPWREGVSQHAVWVSHPIKGLFVRDIDAKNGWLPVSSGLPKLSGVNSEEVASLALIPSAGSAGPGAVAPGAAQPWNLVVGMSFLGKLLQWNPAQKTFVERYSDDRDFGTVESLAPAGINSGYAISEGAVQRFSLGGEGKIRLEPAAELSAAAKTLAEALGRQGDAALCLSSLPFADKPPEASGPIPAALSELWLLFRGQAGGQSPGALRRSLAQRKNGIYLQTGFVLNAASRAKYFDLIVSLGLNSLVVDLKDDYGRLRFAPRSPLLSGKSSTRDALDIETFAAEAKARGIYLIARIVVFKDEALYKWNNAALAVRDSATKAPWQGKKADGQLIQEYWVDPYSTDVWRYNVEIAKEVTARGFDEIQFDYIRFPTDGENLNAAYFPRQETGMTQDSALESFLRYARQSIEAPLSVDIYGANGWYRSGTRTGQDVEMLSNYVDVICPMLYPSHFEQGFLAQAPAELRPYRIYKIGTLRNLAIARDKALVRPYVQAFYLDVSYDRAYYNARYVLEEIRGVREGANQGMTFWNNSGRYADIPPLR